MWFFSSRKTRSSTADRQRRSSRPRLEALEDRCLLSAVLVRRSTLIAGLCPGRRGRLHGHGDRDSSACHSMAGLTRRVETGVR
jgi:hypothetical protein